MSVEDVFFFNIQSQYLGDVWCPSLSIDAMTPDHAAKHVRPHNQVKYGKNIHV